MIKDVETLSMFVCVCVFYVGNKVNDGKPVGTFFPPVCSSSHVLSGARNSRRVFVCVGVWAGSKLDACLSLRGGRARSLMSAKVTFVCIALSLSFLNIKPSVRPMMTHVTIHNY